MRVKEIEVDTVKKELSRGELTNYYVHRGDLQHLLLGGRVAIEFWSPSGRVQLRIKD